QQELWLYPCGRTCDCWKRRLVGSKNQFEVLVEHVARRNAIALIRGNIKSGIFHAEWRKNAPFEKCVKRIAGNAAKDRALDFLLKPIAKFSTGLRFQRQLGKLGNN